LAGGMGPASDNYDSFVTTDETLRTREG
jgi:hypothetical protein